ncbi:hypothetical protein BH09DEP1_BH09DEP1_3240 [soil metagenome]
MKLVCVPFLTLSTFIYAQDQSFEKPTIDQLRNTDQVKISFKCMRDTYAQTIDKERWLSIATAVDTLIDDCYTCVDDDALYTQIFNTIRFVLEQHAEQPGIKINLVVAGQTTNKITEHLIDGKEYTLVTRLSDEQKKQLCALYQQIQAITYTDEELETLLKHSLYFALLDSQKLIGFIRVITDYVTIAHIFDLMLDPEYQNIEFKKLLVHTVINHPKLKQTIIK